MRDYSLRVYGNPATNHMTVGVKTVSSNETFRICGGSIPRALYGVPALSAASRGDGVA